jgi:predicted NBD/HSP70 family sugar kinase
VLVVDIGGTSVKVLASGQSEARRFPSGPTATPEQVATKVRDLSKDWAYDVVALGYPGRVVKGKIVSEPQNLARGWVGFDFEAAFGRPVKVINDAAMQALGSYQGGGTMLFLGLGTGLGSALIVEGNVVPLELGHLSYKDSTFEDYLGIRGLAKIGQDAWEKELEFVVARLIEAIHPDDVVLGGGNVERLETLPAGSRRGTNDNAFTGGFRLWHDATNPPGNPPPPRRAE